MIKFDPRNLLLQLCQKKAADLLQFCSYNKCCEQHLANKVEMILKSKQRKMNNKGF